MEEVGCPPDDISYHVIIRGFLHHKDESRAVQLIGEMRDRGFAADAGPGLLTVMEFKKEKLVRFNDNQNLDKMLHVHKTSVPLKREKHRSLKLIARRYMRPDFFIDLVCSITSSSASLLAQSSRHFILFSRLS
ncbi:hypothetical protein OIU76_008650 [Salix suchowensis]|nr:hypothetical protein OIU76_008650 [Salix suchowensis]